MNIAISSSRNGFIENSLINRQQDAAPPILRNYLAGH